MGMGIIAATIVFKAAEMVLVGDILGVVCTTSACAETSISDLINRQNRQTLAA